jgi:hypothetical protein
LAEIHEDNHDNVLPRCQGAEIDENQKGFVTGTKKEIIYPIRGRQGQRLSRGRGISGNVLWLLASNLPVIFIHTATTPLDWTSQP